MAKRSRKKNNSTNPVVILVFLGVVIISLANLQIDNALVTALMVTLVVAVAGLFYFFYWQKVQREAAIALWFARQGYQRDFSSLKPREFETFIAKLYEELGYKTELTPLSGDDGIDVKAVKDGKLTIIQTKQSIHPVGSPVIQTLYGSMAHVLANKAICVSTSGFTSEAARFAEHKNIELLDSNDLFDLIQRCTK
jgi:HJR/Mrr/RecB family endonuclease